jgi:DNA polymerase III subunit epsilon
MGYPKLCFIDCETTGTNPSRHGVIQIGGIISQEAGGALTELEEFSFNVAPYPADQIEEEALGVTGLTREQVKAFPPPGEVHPALLKVFGGHCNKFDKKDKMLFIGYNAQFDYNFLRKWFDKGGDKYFGSWFWNPPVDVMTLAMVRLAGSRPEMPDFKLTTVAGALGIPTGNAHTPLADARMAKRIFEIARGL